MRNEDEDAEGTSYHTRHTASSCWCSRCCSQPTLSSTASKKSTMTMAEIRRENHRSPRHKSIATKPHRRKKRTFRRNPQTSHPDIPGARAAGQPPCGSRQNFQGFRAKSFSSFAPKFSLCCLLAEAKTRTYKDQTQG